MQLTQSCRDGTPYTTKNAVCIHEEDDGILVKHTDFRTAYLLSVYIGWRSVLTLSTGDESSTTTRARKLIISHIFTAGNYEYCVYWVMHQDGVIQLEIKLTGILSTYCLAPDETAEYGTEVYV